jgi:hypothetical protein
MAFSSSAAHILPEGSLAYIVEAVSGSWREIHMATESNMAETIKNGSF